MKGWFNKIFLFTIPILLYVFAFEWYCRHETFFAIKKEYALSNMSTFEVAFTGTSHIEKGIWVDANHAQYLNWAAPGQSYPLEFQLWKKYLTQMPQLKSVVIEFSPVRLFLSPGPDDWAANVYWIHYDIPYKVNVYNPRRSFHVLQDYGFFKQVVHAGWNPFAEKQRIESTGFAPSDFKDRFWQCQFDTAMIRSTFRMKYDFKLSKDLLDENVTYLDSIVEIMKAHGVRPILVLPPFYKTFENAIPAQVKLYSEKVLQTLKGKYELTVWDFEQTENFEVKDFYNDNHLNPDGAQKWFSMLADSINRIEH